MIRRWDYRRRRFPRSPDSYLGVYGSFEEARRAAPGRTGYDHGEMAGIYDDRMQQLFPYDYPVLFWLQRILTRGSQVFDFGGHVGVTYYAFAKLLEYPADLRWVVCDVPAVIERGAALASEQGARQVEFTDNPDLCEGSDVLLALGVLQYLETDLADHLAKLKTRPRHIIVNKTPMIDGEPYLTLQNTFNSYNPYRVLDRAAFIGSLALLGYEVVDSWLNPSLKCSVPYQAEQAVDAYTGVYLRAR
jgi:putative methyltransferase (TIGR04325 family)